MEGRTRRSSVYEVPSPLPKINLPSSHESQTTFAVDEQTNLNVHKHRQLVKQRLNQMPKATLGTVIDFKDTLRRPYSAFISKSARNRAHHFVILQEEARR